MEEICIIVSCDIYDIRYKLTEDFKGNGFTARTHWENGENDNNMSWGDMHHTAYKICTPRIKVKTILVSMIGIPIILIRWP